MRPVCWRFIQCRSLPLMALTHSGNIPYAPFPRKDSLDCLFSPLQDPLHTLTKGTIWTTSLSMAPPSSDIQWLLNAIGWNSNSSHWQTRFWTNSAEFSSLIPSLPAAPPLSHVSLWTTFLLHQHSFLPLCLCAAFPFPWGTPNWGWAQSGTSWAQG